METIDDCIRIWGSVFGALIAIAGRAIELTGMIIKWAGEWMIERSDV